MIHIKCGTLDDSSKPPLSFNPSMYLIFLTFNTFPFPYSSSTWRLMGSAWFPSSIILIQLTNELGWFTGQRSNGGICNVVFLKHVFSGHTATQLQQAAVSELCLLFILKCATMLSVAVELCTKTKLQSGKWESYLARFGIVCNFTQRGTKNKRSLLRCIEAFPYMTF